MSVPLDKGGILLFGERWPLWGSFGRELGNCLAGDNAKLWMICKLVSERPMVCHNLEYLGKLCRWLANSGLSIPLSLKDPRV